MSNRKNNNFDLLRLFAAIQVFVYHAINHFKLIDKKSSFWPIISQFPGVPIFFFISGFLIAASYQNNQNDIKKYFRNRLLRIYPALWVCLIFTIILLSIFKIIDWRLPETYFWIFCQSTFLQFYTADSIQSFGLGNPNGSLWSIVVELQFYLILPIIIYIITKLKSQKSQNLFLFVLFIISFALGRFWESTINSNPSFDIQSVENSGIIIANKLISLTVFWHLYYFVIGIYFHINFSKILPIIANKFWLWLIVYIAYFSLASLYLKLYYNPYYYNFWAILSLILLALVTFSAAYSYTNLSAKLLNHNDISYGIYIYHMPIVNLFIHLKFKNHWLSLLISIIIVINLAILSWNYIEKRALTYKNKING